MSKRDYYEVLGVPRDSSEQDLKRAYRKLARELHPDRNPDDPAAEDAFKEASEAYRVLSDAEQRKRYDRFGHAAFESGGPGGFDPTDFGSMGDLLEGILGGVFGTRKRRGGRDLTYDLDISFDEAALGVEKSITVRRPGPCDRCHGNGAEPGTPVSDCGNCRGSGQVRFQRGFFAAARTCPNCAGTGKQVKVKCTQCTGTGVFERDEAMQVRIPPGVEDKAVRTVRGAGEVVASGAGDLHITVHVAEHPLFQREGADVLCEVPVTFPQAVLGSTLEVPTLEGKVNMKLPAGTQSGKVFRLRGKGIPVYGGMGKGDQLVTVVIEVPEKVSRQQRKLIEALATEMGTETLPRRASFLGKLRDLFD